MFHPGRWSCNRLSLISPAAGGASSSLSWAPPLIYCLTSSSKSPKPQNPKDMKQLAKNRFHLFFLLFWLCSNIASRLKNWLAETSYVAIPIEKMVGPLNRSRNPIKILVESEFGYRKPTQKWVGQNFRYRDSDQTNCLFSDPESQSNIKIGWICEQVSKSDLKNHSNDWYRRVPT